tara:strand:+ start:28589 stop:29002 length:414 start_codon:yes stop_codon:yes gene_type:complete
MNRIQTLHSLILLVMFSALCFIGYETFTETPDEAPQTKIFIMDMNAFVDAQIDLGSEPLQVLADTENLMKALRLQGYLVIDRSSVLTSPEEYNLPEIDMQNVYAWLKQNRITPVEPGDMKSRFEKSQKAVSDAFMIK